TGLTTSVTGGSGTNLSLNFSTLKTMQDLAEFINAQPGYTASLPTDINPSLNPGEVLDRVTGVGICSTGSAITAGKLFGDAWTLFDHFQRFSGLVSATRDSFVGLPDEVSPKAFL